MDAWLVFEVMVFLAFHDSNQSDSHGREYVFLSIHAIPEKAFEMLLILETVPCGRCFCINVYLLENPIQTHQVLNKDMFFLIRFDRFALTD